MQINNLADFLHHVANVIRFDNESDYNNAHQFIDQAYPIAVISGPAVTEAATVLPVTDTPISLS